MPGYDSTAALEIEIVPGWEMMAPIVEGFYERLCALSTPRTVRWSKRRRPQARTKHIRARRNVAEERQIALADVGRALSRLPPHERKVLELHYGEHWSHRQIARHFGAAMPLSGSRSQHERVNRIRTSGLQRLAGVLKQLGIL